MMPLAGADGETIEEIEAIQPTPIETNVSDLQEFLPSLESPLAIEPDLGDVPISNDAPIPFINDPENMDPASFFNATGKLPQQLELENLSQEEVPMERYATTNPDAPNIFRENRSKVLYNGMKVEECAMGMQFAMLSENTINRIGHSERKALGIAGNAWNTGNNIIEKGGYRIYGLHEGTGGLSTNSLRRKLIGNRNKQDTAGIAEEMMVGDVVEMYYQDSDHQNDATATGSGGVHTTHIGMVSVDGEGNKYVTHNIGGVWHTDGLDKILNRSNGYFVSGVVRPAYTQENKGVYIGDGSLNYKKASGKTTPVERSPEEIEAWKNKMDVSGRKSRINPFLTGLEYYAPYIQEDTGVSNEDMANLIMPVSYGLYGLESGFNNPESKFGAKAPFRNLWRGLKESGRPVTGFLGLGDLRGALDPMSEGSTQIKLGQDFPASEQGKNFMERYGVDEETIYDPSVAASITQRLTINNMNHLKGILGASRFDALPIETKRNLLFKAHNKGIKNLIEKDFSKKVGEDEYKLTPNSINAGLKTYSNLHIVGEEPYTNNGNDYALEINVDYNRVLAMHEESARRGYNVRPYITATEMAEDFYDKTIGDTWSTAQADANSVLQEGRNQLKNVRSTTEKASKEGYTRINDELQKKLLTPAEVAGERFFDEMLSIGTIAGEKGENLKQELVQPVNATVEEQIKNVTKALEHDMDNFVIQSEGTLNDVKSDTAEIVARKTPIGKIVAKITETDNAIDSIPGALTGSRVVLQEFNEFMDTIPNEIPMTVQAQMLSDGRVANREMSMEQWYQEYLSGETPFEDELLEAAPDSVLPDLEYLQENERIDELVSMRDGGYLPKYQEGNFNDTDFFTSEEKLDMLNKSLTPNTFESRVNVQDNTSAPITPLWDIAQRTEKLNSDISTPEGALEWNKNWINSSMHKKMLTNELKDSKDDKYSVEEYTQKRLKNIKNINIEKHDEPTNNGVLGDSNILTGGINLYPDPDSDLKYPSLAAIHEVSHSSDRPSLWEFLKDPDAGLIPQSSADKISKYRWNEDLRENYLDVYNNPTQRLSELDLYNRERADYISQKSEVRARLKSVQAGAQKMGIYDPFTEEITLGQLEELLNRGDELEINSGYNALYDLENIFSIEEILDMLNTISYEESSDNELLQARTGGYLPKHQLDQVPTPPNPYLTPITSPAPLTMPPAEKINLEDFDILGETAEEGRKRRLGNVLSGGNTWKGARDFWKSKYQPLSQNTIEGKQWIKDYTNSPMHAKMLAQEIETGGDTPEDLNTILEGRKANVEHTSVSESRHHHPSYFNPFTGTVTGQSHNITGDITLYPEHSSDTMAHEGSHSADRPLQPSIFEGSGKYMNSKRRLIPDSSRKMMKVLRYNDKLQGNELDTELYTMLKGLEEKGELSEWERSIFNEEKQKKGLANYLTKTTEGRARIVASREGAQKMGIYDPFTENITDEQFEELWKRRGELSDQDEYNPFFQLEQIYTKEEIRDMMQTISDSGDNTREQFPTGRYGGYLPKYQDGTRTLNSPYFSETDFFTDEEKQDMLLSGQRVPPNLGPIDFNAKPSGSFTKEDWDRMHEDKRSRVERFLGTETYNRLKDRPEFKGENVAEIFDGLGSSSWNDALQSHDQWHKSGRTYPTFDEGVEMFGAIPMIGKAKRGFSLAKGAKGDIIKAGKKIRTVADNVQKTLNIGDASKDMYEEDLPAIESIQPTRPGALSKEVKKSLPQYQDGNWFSRGWDYLFGDDEPEVKSINTGPTPAEVRAKQDSTAREYFKTYLREEEARPAVMAAENSAIRKPGGGYYKKREDSIFYPYKLDKENKHTIGYGHSKKGVENFTKGITEQQAERYLEEDINTAMRRTGEYVNNNPNSPFYSDTTQSFETLDPQTQYMLADYPFNIGKLSKFKKYAGAVLSGDTTKAKLQYKRYANNDKNQPLGRNNAYYDSYIEPWLETYRK